MYALADNVQEAIVAGVFALGVAIVGVIGVWVGKKLDKVNSRVSAVDAQLRPNGGSSAVDRLTAEMSRLSSTVSALVDRLTRHEDREDTRFDRVEERHERLALRFADMRDQLVEYLEEQRRSGG